MTNKIFSQEEQSILLNNENIYKVSQKSITYHPDFKIKAVRANIFNKIPPTLIFTNAGIDLNIIGHDNPKRCLDRWRKIYEQHGELGLIHERRGKTSGSPSIQDLTIEEKLRRAEAKIYYLEKENELLKKLEEIERSVINKPSRKYMLIHSLLKTYSNSLKCIGFCGMTVGQLCEIAGVSRSGYYRWLSCESNRTVRERSDYECYLLIKKIFLKKNRKAGWRIIKMNLERSGINMNHKKIRRLMKKYNLITKIRRPNPYRQIAKATIEHSSFSNILNREFRQQQPYKAFGTDITYLYYGNGQRSYLSIILDFASGEIVSYHLSTTLGMELSLEPVRKLVQIYGPDMLIGSLIHSDQGIHYTNPSYYKYLKDLKVTQSMSRKGNCLDNAPVESFFGHMKDEIDVSNCKSIVEVKSIIDKYIYNYNYHRYQWGRKKMAPVEYRNHLLSA